MTDTALSGGPAISSGRKWGTLAIGCLAVLLLSIDVTVLHLAVPKLTAALLPTATQTLWILDVYGFALAGLLITMGNVGDRIGRKRLLLIGTAAFGAASAITAYAPTPELLIAARALLGVAGATIMPSTLSLVRNVFTDPAERTAAIGIWSGMGAGGFALGPVIGGLLLDHFWWGSVFLINLPIMVVLFAAGLAVLPESRNPRPGRLDPPSVVLSIAGVVGVIYTIKEAAMHGLGRPNVLAALAIGLAAIAAFSWRQTRLAQPLIDVRLFRHRAFTGAVSANIVGIFAMSAMSFIFAQYFQLVLGWSPLVAGLAGLPGGAMGAVGGVLAARLVPRLGRAGVVSLGLALSAVSFVLYVRAEVDSSYLVFLFPMLFGGAGIGLAFAVTNDTVLASVPKERAGAASAISETAFELGGALGIAVLGSILGSAYRAGLRLPEGVPAQAATPIGEGLGTALAVAGELPGRLGEAVAAAARVAFLDGMRVSLVSGAAILLTLAAVVLFTMRGLPTVIEDSPESPDPAPGTAPDSAPGAASGAGPGAKPYTRTERAGTGG
ncbi:MFS transporter [Bailinhaonella thermotolerans]|uniref:MFS transporter n=1 Tax=Bailinhaonella thermotolerans TaxID=1070861 RepID=A0A3A4ABG1_9ACTN|nr:MFS transporter [Bailinhaonella thermotolerans]RJL24157.1 MFS transporter [Bailinhaonella thermotolerans]